MERLKRFILGSHPGGKTAPTPPSGPGAGEAVDSSHERHSHGLEQFSSSLQGEQGLYVLDLGGLTQANVTFITALGHKLYSEAFLRLVEAAGLPQDTAEGQSGAETEAFLNHALGFPEAHFDGVLAWDALEFLPRPALRATVDRLFKILKPGGYLLAFFHADEKAATVPVYSYRISCADTLQLAHLEMRHPVQHFNSRTVERLFQRFQSVKFFLARDNLREVIVRR